MASVDCKEKGLQKSAVWLDQRTHKSLRDAAGAIAMAAYSVTYPTCWAQLTERCLLSTMCVASRHDRVQVGLDAVYGYKKG